MPIPPGIIAADIVGANRRENPAPHTLRRELLDSLGSVAPPHSDLRDTPFGVQLVVSDPRDTYQIVRSLLTAWMKIKDDTPSPLMLGLKLGLHAGWNLQNSSDNRMGLSSLGKTFRIAWAGPSDAIRLSERMYNVLEEQLSAAGIVGMRRQFQLDYEFNMPGVEIPVGEFLRPDQFRISVSPPDDLMRYLANEPQFLYVLDPSAFEGVVRRIFSDIGYEVDLTQRTRDGGIDLIAVRNSKREGLSEKYLIQCKRNAADRHVGVGVVRELIGVGALEPSTGLVFVTTSSFSKPALELARQPATRWRLHLKDYSDLQHWLSAYKDPVSTAAGISAK